MTFYKILGYEGSLLNNLVLKNCKLQNDARCHADTSDHSSLEWASMCWNIFVSIRSPVAIFSRVTQCKLNTSAHWGASNIHAN